MQRILSFALLLLFASSVHAQIYSTSGGGAWATPATWSSGVVPGENDHAVIQGPVTISQGLRVARLTVDAAGTLTNPNGCDCTVTVTGTIENHGTIQNIVSNWWLYVRAEGDVINHGYWATYRTILTGAGDQAMTQGTGAVWGGVILAEKPSGRVLAQSDLAFSGSTDFNGTTLVAGTHRVAVREGGWIEDAVVEIDGEFAQVAGTRSAAESVRFVGTTRLVGTVNMGRGNVFEGSVVVQDTLQNVLSCDCTVEVLGDIVNNGVVRNVVSNWWLYLRITGSLTNNGEWSNYRTLLTGTTDQRMSQAAGAVWRGPMESLKESGRVTAGSDLTFADWFDLNTDTLIVAPYDLTVIGGGYLYEAAVVMDGALTQEDGTHSAADYSRFIGTTRIRNRVNVGRDLVFEGLVVVEDTLQNVGGCDCHMYVQGDIENNGTIRSYNLGNWWLYLHVSGSLANNGTWSNYRTYLDGTADQELAQASGTTWAGPIESLKETGHMRATSDLRFSNWVDLNGDSLYVGEHEVAVSGGGYLYEATVFIDGVFTQIDATQAAADYTRFVGSTRIRNTVHLGRDIIFDGDLVVEDTLQNIGGCDCWAYVYGDLVNRGTIRNTPNSNWWLYLNVTGSLRDEGSQWSNHQTRLYGDGPRTWYAPLATTPFRMTGGSVQLVGDNRLAQLTVDAAVGPTVASGASLRVDGGIDPRFVNFGTIRSVASGAASATVSPYRTRVRFAAGSFDSLAVTHHGNQVPDTYGNAVRSFWTFESSPPASSTSLEYVDFYYDDAQLGMNDENTLDVYFSEDGGLRWMEVSSQGNLERYPNENRVRLSGAPAHGRFVLSSYADPLSVVPTIVTSIIGRSQIRVGPPNRYSIHYVNNSDVASGDFLVQLLTGGGVHLRSVEPSAPTGVSPRSIPLDSLTYDGEDEEAYLWISSMAPREERTFDVILGAIPDPTGKRLESQDPEELITFITVAAVWAGKALITKYAVEVTAQFAEEIWRPVAPCETVMGALGDAIKDSFSKVTRRWVGYEKPVKVIGEGLQDEALKRLGVDIPGKDFVEVAGSFYVRGPQRYLNGGFKVKDCNGNETKVTLQTGQNDRGLEKVTSWDPNEKVAPAGVGEAGYMAAAGRMTYQILFENKKEATAPAWKVIIDDTLATEFDASTVVFEAASHEGFSFTVDGQVLHWEIEDIELPPNVTPPEGEGYVSFSVQPVSGLASGTALRNRAQIIFDLNKPILTNEVVNTLDFHPPVTQMESLPATLSADSLTVRWAAIDGNGESGVYTTTLFGAVDGGPFEAVATTRAGAHTLDVTSGHTYSFYAISRDEVGNVETTRPEIVSVSIISGTGIEGERPYEFALHPAFPNPFNPVTTLSFSLPTAGPARLIVFDALGREVTRLVDGELPPGRHQVHWDASRFASGVYFSRLSLGAQTAIRSLVLLK